jgi:hypothetical protein
MKGKRTKRKTVKWITSEELDAKFDRGEDITPYMDLKNAVMVQVHRVNVDFPAWIIKRLDHEATKLNVSRQAIIKMWIHDRITAPHRAA